MFSVGDINGNIGFKMRDDSKLRLKNGSQLSVGDAWVEIFDPSTSRVFRDELITALRKNIENSSTRAGKEFYGIFFRIPLFAPT